MSEYQYYHFQVLDQPLNERQMRALRAISTRAEITPTSFINTYNFGDLKADPRELVRQYFDAHVYIANWGTHRFMLKIPRDLIDLGRAELYGGECLDISVNKTHVILDFTSEDESGDYDDEWDSGEGWMASLLPLREEIMQGDLRALYIAWLAGIGEDDDIAEPPLPAGMSRLSGPLQRLADFLRLDEHLLQAALQGDAQAAPVEPSRAAMAAWVESLAGAEKDAMLVALLAADAESRSLTARLRQRFHKDWQQVNPAQAASQVTRTADQLWHVRETLAAAAQRQKAEAAARQRLEREREAAEQRQQYLASLATREANVWQEVGALLGTTVPKNYDDAVRLLRDLRDLAREHGQITAWERRIMDFRQRHGRKPSLMRRFNQAGFP